MYTETYVFSRKLKRSAVYLYKYIILLLNLCCGSIFCIIAVLVRILPNHCISMSMHVCLAVGRSIGRIVGISRSWQLCWVL